MLMVVALATATLAQAAAPTISLQALSLTRDAPGHKLATPTSLDRASPTLPYGASVLVEVRVTGDAPIVAVDGYKVLPQAFLDLGLAKNVEQGWSDQTTLFDDGSSGDKVAGDGIWSRELRFPYCIMRHAAALLPAGQYTLRFVAIDAEGNRSEGLPVTFSVQPPVAKGGSPPVVTFAGTVPGNVSGPLGTPFLVTARVSDADGDLLQVMAIPLEGSPIYMADDGSAGDQVAGDEVWTCTRVIGDAWTGARGTEAEERTLEIVAVDAAGHVSERVPLHYQARFDEHDLAYSLEPGAGPTASDVRVNLASGPAQSTIVISVRAPANCFVVGKVLMNPPIYGYGHDDGFEGDAVAGDGVYSALLKLPEQAPRGLYELVIFALPKDGRLAAGNKVAVSFQALAPDQPEVLP
jgi:hypothetical protein